jgi:hypothetical protein
MFLRIPQQNRKCSGVADFSGKAVLPLPRLDVRRSSGMFAVQNAEVDAGVFEGATCGV